MTSSLLAPCRHRADGGAGSPEAVGSADATRILDWQSETVRQFTGGIDAPAPLDFLTEAHRLISTEIRPVYALEERQPASTTIRRGVGSCSQRLAVLEAAARSRGIPTRVHGICVDGSFWYPRFSRLTAIVPTRVIVAWPEFSVDDQWLSISELYGSLGELSSCGTGFSNDSGETLFDAVRRTAVDWAGVTDVPSCDLSAVVREDLGHFDSRDDLFSAHGQTLAWLPRLVGDPLMRRRAAEG